MAESDNFKSDNTQKPSEENDVDLAENKTFPNSLETTFTENAKSLQCNVCCKTFTDRRKLTRHVQSVHEAVRKHQCDDCPADFSTTTDQICH